MIPAVNIATDFLPWLTRSNPDVPGFSRSDATHSTMAPSTAKSYSTNDIERELESHYDKVYRFVAGMTWGSGLDAEDLTQDVFVKAYRNVSGFNRDSSLSTWLYRIARNTVTDAMRKRSVRRAFGAIWPLNEDNEPMEIAQSESDDEQMDVREVQLIVRKAIAELEEPYRSLVIWRELEELPYREIAEITGESEGTLKSRLFYGKKKLREILLKKGVDYENE
jgi:RNA polymerase sigma-70 factor (ECF subfamily)